jgi:tetraacyldisaccharide 4'-kinase
MSRGWIARLEDPPRWAAPALAAGEILFRAGVAVRGAAYDRGWLKSARAPLPVISVGNLTAGGTGKTPLVIALAGRLMARGLRVAVVSRGYGRSGSAPLVVVARDGRIAAGAAEAGDEPLLIAAETSANVVVAPDRLRGAVHARSLGADLVILDDGFQHRRLRRDLDLVVIDARDPFAGGRLIPRGRLREPPGALARADLLVVHRGDVSAPVPTPPAFGAAVQVALSPRAIRDRGAALEPSALAGKRAALIAAIARPERFLSTVERLGAEVVATAFLPDHAPLDAGALEEFRARARRARADLLLTTSKDAARLGPELEPSGLAVLEVELVVLEGERELEAALDRIGEARPSPP